MGRCGGGGGGGGGDAVQAVEDDEAIDKPTTLFSSRGRSDITEDIGVAYAFVGISSSVIVVVDMVGVGGSNENGRLRGSGIGELGIGDFGKSPSCQVPGIKGAGKIQVAVNVTP
jgi:hypothetical protein